MGEAAGTGLGITRCQTLMPLAAISSLFTLAGDAFFAPANQVRRPSRPSTSSGWP